MKAVHTTSERNELLGMTENALIQGTGLRGLKLNLCSIYIANVENGFVRRN